VYGCTQSTSHSCSHQPTAVALQVVFTLIVPIAGAVSDRGLPRVTTNIVICCVCGAIYVPTFLAFHTRSIVACWLLQGVHLGLTAWAMGVLPAIVSRIYPAGVRITGFNLGHNLGEPPLLLLGVQQESGMPAAAPQDANATLTNWLMD
jgi:MFS family permease